MSLQASDEVLVSVYGLNFILYSDIPEQCTILVGLLAFALRQRDYANLHDHYLSSADIRHIDFS